MRLDILDPAQLNGVERALYACGYFLLAVTALGLLAAALLKFLEHARNPRPLAKSRRHPFSTLGMAACIAAMFPFWRLNAGMMSMRETFTRTFIGRVWGFDSPLMDYDWLLVFLCFYAVGAVMVVAAFAWHIRAKLDLRLMWSDGIEIKRDHALATTGAYALARHPMYASLLMWCWGASLLMANLATFLITTCVMLPLMRWRAKAEEAELLAAHPDYALYQGNVRMLAPTLRGGSALAAKTAAIALLGYWTFMNTFYKFHPLVDSWLKEPGKRKPAEIFVCCDMSSDWVLLPPMLFLLLFVHLFLGYCLTPAKVAFSYRSKSGMMLAFWLASQLWSPAFYAYWLILAMFVYGLFFNCPCMWVYERFGGCPCFRLLGKCFGEKCGAR